MPQETITLKLVAQDLASGNISKAVAGIDKLAQRGGIAGSVLQGVGLSFGMMLNPLNLASRGIGAVTDYMGDAIEAASDLEESTSKVSEVFDDQAQAVLDWAQSLDSAYGLTEQAALESAGTFGNFTQALGLAEDESVKFGTTLTELAGDLGSFSNINVNDVLVSLRSGLAGEAEPMRRLGVDVSAARVEALLLADGIAKVNGKFTEGQKVRGRYLAIMEDTAKAQGDAARTADTLAGSQRELQAETGNLAAKIGESLLPYQKAWNEALLKSLELVDDILNAGTSAPIDLAEREQRARVAFEDLASDIGISYDELAQRIIDVTGEEARSFHTLMSAYGGLTVATQSVVKEGGKHLADMRRMTELAPHVSGQFEGIAESAGWAAGGLGEVSEALKEFRDNLDDFDDVRGIGAINDELREQRKLAREALEAGNAAKWARAQAAIEALEQERELNRQARAAMAETKERNAARKQMMRDIATTAGVSEKRVRDELKKTGGDVDAVKRKLGIEQEKLEEIDNTTARPKIGMDLSEWNTRMAQWRIDMAEIRAASGVTYDPLTGQVRETAAASQKKMKQPHGGGFVRAGETAIIRQNEAVLTPASGTNIVPLDGPFAPKGGRAGGITNVFNFEGATFLASEQEARAWAAKITPHITREQRRLGVA